MVIVLCCNQVGKSGYFDSQTAREVPCLCMSGMSLMRDTFLNIYVVIGNDLVSMLKLSVLLYCLCSVFHIPESLTILQADIHMVKSGNDLFTSCPGNEHQSN